jgi:alkane 1-monooxygenase
MPRMTTLPPDQVASPSQALPFWLSLGTVPMAFLGMGLGGLWVLALPLYCWALFSLLDALTGLNTDNADPDTPEDDLHLYRLLTMIWFPVQFLTLCVMLWFVPQAGHLNIVEKVLLFTGMGVMSGTIGINYSHELMHQKSAAGTLAGRPLAGHRPLQPFPHRTPARASPLCRHPARCRDRPLQRGFHRFFPRVLRESWISAFRAEKAMLARKGLPWTHPSNPFWRYWAAARRDDPDRAVAGRLAGLVLFLHPGRHRRLAAGADELRRTLRPDPPPPGRGQV